MEFNGELGNKKRKPPVCEQIPTVRRVVTVAAKVRPVHCEGWYLFLKCHL